MIITYAPDGGGGDDGDGRGGIGGSHIVLFVHLLHRFQVLRI